MTIQKLKSVLLFSLSTTILPVMAQVVVRSADQPVEPGIWHTSYDKVIAMATQENIPVVAVLGSSTCGHCTKFDGQIQLKAFTDWQADRKYLLLYVKANKDWYSNSNVNKTWTRSGHGELPRGFIYWKNPGTGRAYEEIIEIRTWESNGKGFMDYVDSKIGAYKPIGRVNVETGAGLQVVEGQSVNVVVTRTSEQKDVTATLSITDTALATQAGVKLGGAAITTTNLHWNAGDKSSRTVSVYVANRNGYQDDKIPFSLMTTPVEAMGTNTAFSISIIDAQGPLVFPEVSSPANNSRFSLLTLDSTFMLNHGAIQWPVGVTAKNLEVCWKNDFTQNGHKSIDPDVAQADAIALEMVKNNAPAGRTEWWLKATFTDAADAQITRSSPSLFFDIVEAPVFGGASPDDGSTVTAYKSVQTAIVLEVAAASNVTFAFDKTTKLPRGLTAKQSGKSYILSGAISATGVFPIKVTVTDADQEQATLAFTLNVQALSTSTQAGKFNLLFWDPDSNTLAGTSVMSVSSTGRITASVAFQKKTYSFSSGIWTDDGNGAFSSTITLRTGETLVLALQADGSVSGTLTINGKSYTVDGAHQSALPVGVAGYYTAGIFPEMFTANDAIVNNQPQGSGYLTFTISSTGSGSIRYSGKLADGTTLSGSSFFIDRGDTLEIPVFKALYSKAGVFSGIFNLDKASGVEANTLSGSAQWNNEGKSTYQYADGFAGVVSLAGGWFTKNQDLSAYYLNQYTFGTQTPNGPATSGIDPALVPDGLALVMSGTTLVTDKDATAAKTTFKALRSTGLISGSFYLQNTVTDSRGRTSVKSIRTPFYGVLLKNVEDCGGAGYYTFTDSTSVAPNGKKISSLKRSFNIMLTPVE